MTSKTLQTIKAQCEWPAPEDSTLFLDQLNACPKARTLKAMFTIDFYAAGFASYGTNTSPSHIDRCNFPEDARQAYKDGYNAAAVAASHARAFGIK